MVLWKIGLTFLVKIVYILHPLAIKQFHTDDRCEGSATLDDSRYTNFFLTIDSLCNKLQAKKVQTAMKLHRQFGHSKGSGLINLVKSGRTALLNIVKVWLILHCLI